MAVYSYHNIVNSGSDHRPNYSSNQKSFGEMWKSRGIYLIGETEEMAIDTSGKIMKIVEPSEYVRMKVDGHYGADLYVDGERYLIVTADGYDVGDEILIKYLPMSKCILKIDKAD